MNSFLLLNTKEDILKIVVTKQLMDPIDFHSIILQNIFFCVEQKEIQGE